MIPGLTGTPLFKRGYKREQHKAPINECLAAAMVLMSGWNDDQTLLDPMCGSATIAIEAALKALNKPAGLLRPNYGIKHILGFDVGEWNSLRTDLKYQGNKDFEGRILATDHDRRAIQAAQKNAKTAGVDHLIEFKVCDFRETEIPYGDGVVVMNPPYGERIGHDQQLESL